MKSKSSPGKLLVLLSAFTPHPSRIRRKALAGAVMGVWLGFGGQGSLLLAQPPSLINYQGRLVDGTNLVNGSVGMTLRLYNAPSGGTLLYADSNNVTVVDGLYHTFLGDNTTSGNLVAALTNFSVWLEAVVNGTPLTPREQVASVAYALSVRGLRVSTNNSAILLPDLNTMDAGTSWAAIGGGSDNHVGNAANYSVVAGGVQNRISAQAQESVISGGGFNAIGTNATQSVISGGSQNRIGPLSQYGVVGGGVNNIIGTNTLGGTISGGGNHVIESGGTTPTISGGLANRIDGNASYAVIAGGHNNRISTNASGAVVSGGDGNRIWQGSLQSVIAGGRENTIAFFTEYATIGGGRGNDVDWNSHYAVVGGGLNNDLGVSAHYAVIAGGLHNFALNSASNAFIGGGMSNRVSSFGTIPGGRDNFATEYAFAAGRRARAVHPGSFVWGDNTDSNILTTADNQFLIRAGGGLGVNVPSIGPGVTADFGDRVRVRGSTAGIWMYDTALSSDRGFVGLVSANHIGLYGHHGAGWGLVMSVSNGYVGIGTITPTNPLQMASGAYVSPGGTWVSVSDAGRKQNFAPVNTRDILEKVAALPITTWSYTAEPGIKHIGPTAQDFYAAFGVGPGETAIAQIDPDGVALAAIQALAKEKTVMEEKVSVFGVRVSELEEENARLRARLEALESKLGL